MDGVSGVIREVQERLRALPPDRRPRFRPPAARHEVESCLAERGLAVPVDIKELYEASDGLDLGTFAINSILETYWLDPLLFVIHIWGNGDVDCVDLSHPDGPHAIVFMGHDPPWEFRVCASLEEWLRRLVDEFIEYGTIYSPWDCYVSQVDRLYAHTPASE